MDGKNGNTIVQIKTKDYGKVRELFAPLEEYQPMCTAVLDGIWSGQIWGDNPENPQSAILITFLSGGGAAWCFLAGKPNNVGFNTFVNKGLFEELVAGKEVGIFLFTCSPENWDGQLEIVGKPRQPATMYRQHYVCRELTYNWRSN